MKLRTHRSIPPVEVANPGTVILQDVSAAGRESWLVYASPREILEAHRWEEVLPLLARVDEATGSGLHAAGFLSYEAAPAMDPAFATRSPGPWPLAWFGLYPSFTRLPRMPVPGPRHIARPAGELEQPVWTPTESDAEHRRSVERIRAWIAAGDVYQVNHTHRLRATLREAPWDFFRRLVGAQHGRYAAWVATADAFICSASPELFFRLDGDRIESRPMKGTAPRGRSSEEDEQHRDRLLASAKERAENVMITDMVRNDLGRIAATGSVRVDRLWEIERYDTVWQLTSTVSAETGVGLVDIFRALFPGASITGAPKVRAMEIIAELERHPRGLYTGCIGRVGPGRTAAFNLAIRTAVIRRDTAESEYGTGGGIVWDSKPEREREECRHKARLLALPLRPDFRLFETMRAGVKGSIFLRDLHLDRLAASARYFGFRFDRAAALGVIERRARGPIASRPYDHPGPDAREGARAVHGSDVLPPVPRRIRLFLARDGKLSCDETPLGPGSRMWTVAFASEPVDERDPFLFHKTTRRGVYRVRRGGRPGTDDVLLWNSRGELTESTRANVAVRLGGVWVTPALRCGLLPGTLREAFLRRGRLREAIIRVDEAQHAEQIVLFNSLRGVIRVALAPYTVSRLGAPAGGSRIDLTDLDRTESLPG